MPKYKNISTNGESLYVTSISGKKMSVQPGQQVETYMFLDSPIAEKISDTPYWNPVDANSAVLTFTGVQTKTVAFDPHDIAYVQIWQIDVSSITVFLQDETNTPAYAKLNVGDSEMIVVGQRFSKIVLKSSGNATCSVRLFTQELNNVLN